MVRQTDIVAVGGDLSPQRLIHAYANGIFPWYAEGEPILWWSPDPRLVLFPSEVHISRSMRRVLSHPPFDRITLDRNFREVIEACRESRIKQPGTWITPAILEAYNQLHEIGLAHSIEVWRQGKLAAGLYGVSLGKCFFGESMFHRQSNASKFAFIKLAQKLEEWGFLILDCQVSSPFLQSLGTQEIPRQEFLQTLYHCLEFKTQVGRWNYTTPAPLPWTP
jgi:leucyl/phenylalanyl-tRNA--protein transferase